MCLSLELTLIYIGVETNQKQLQQKNSYKIVTTNRIGHSSCNMTRWAPPNSHLDDHTKENWIRWSKQYRPTTSFIQQFSPWFSNNHESDIQSYFQQFVLSRSRKCIYFLQGIDFVNLSVGFSFVSTFLTWILFSVRMKWYLTLMCLVLSWWTWSLVKQIALRLSQKMIALS